MAEIQEILADRGSNFERVQTHLGRLINRNGCFESVIRNGFYLGKFCARRTILQDIQEATSYYSRSNYCPLI